MNKLIFDYMVGNHKFRMNDKLSLFDFNTNKELPFFVFSLNAYNLRSLIHQSTCPSLDNHVMNGHRTQMISTGPEA